jgi:uncharacterized membrane protein (UPF0127 family)
MKQIILLFLLAGVVITVGGLLSKTNNSGEFLARLVQQTMQVNRQTSTVIIGGHTFKVEIARTQEERAIGLTKYESLPEDFGMLFILPNDSEPAFWMKGMKFPIDIIWINNNKVVKIDSNLPPAPRDLPDQQIPKYLPGQPVDLVLEIAGNEAAKKGIKVGDNVETRY